MDGCDGWMDEIPAKTAEPTHQPTEEGRTPKASLGISQSRRHSLSRLAPPTTHHTDNLIASAISCTSQSNATSTSSSDTAAARRRARDASHFCSTRWQNREHLAVGQRSRARATASPEQISEATAREPLERGAREAVAAARGRASSQPLELTTPTTPRPQTPTPRLAGRVARAQTPTHDRRSRHSIVRVGSISL